MPKKTVKKSVDAPSSIPRSSRSNLIIGLTGPLGSGCSEMYKVLESEFSFKAFKFSDNIREECKAAGTLKDKGTQGWRKVLQDHGNQQRKSDKAYWIKKIVESIDQADIGESNIVIDGFRNYSEVQEIRKIFPRFFLVAICAYKDERRRRVLKDYGGNSNEFNDDDRRDQNEDFEWGQSVQRCVDDADYVYYNNKSLTVETQGETYPDERKIKRTFKSQASDFIHLMKEEDGVRAPRQEEIQIVTAYAQSNSSTCKKRHVGATIKSL